jgi:4-amino-4-deoxy-L-arabinose transferase-like glycosyltransferase
MQKITRFLKEDAVLDRRWKRILAVGFVLLVGLLLRLYHLDFPSICYHNMQENQYLSMADIMRKTGNYLTRNTYFDAIIFPEGAKRPLFKPPLVAYQILLSWRFLGENLWAPRLTNIAFSIGSILLVYFIGCLIFGSSILAIYSALLFAIMPLGVFFSQRLQPDSAALFFMLLGVFCYLRFVVSRGTIFLFGGGFSFFLAWLYKTHYIFGLIAVLFFIPWKNIKKEKPGLVKTVVIFFLPYLLILVYLGFFLGSRRWVLSLSFDFIKGLLGIFSPSYWGSSWLGIRSYLVDNFTVFFTSFTALGLLLAFLGEDVLLNRFLRGWAVTLLLYAMFFSQELRQQNFVQMPFLAMVCFASTSLVYFFAETVRRSLRLNILVVFMVGVLGLASPMVYGSLQRMYMSFFPGLEVAGVTLKELTAPNEHIFLLTHAQGYAIARYAQRYVDWPKDIKEFKDRQTRYNVRYICVSPLEYLLGIKRDQPEIFSYIQENFHIRELGFTEEGRQLAYIILEKGQGQDLIKSLENFSGPTQSRAVYNLYGRLIFFYSMQPGLPSPN